MCSHDKFTIWLSHDHSVKIRICDGCHEPEWLSANHYDSEGVPEPEWETMIAQILAKDSADLAGPPADDEIPF